MGKWLVLGLVALAGVAAALFWIFREPGATVERVATTSGAGSLSSTKKAAPTKKTAPTPTKETVTAPPAVEPVVAKTPDAGTVFADLTFHATRCPVCGHVNKPGSTACKKDGESLSVVACVDPGCKARLPVGSEFCHMCRKPSSLHMVRITPDDLHKACKKAGRTCDKPIIPKKPFYIDRTEVTVAAYRKCVRDNKCAVPGMHYGCSYAGRGRDRLPVNCVSFAAAARFCRWAGKKLPTDLQWTAAAGGLDGRRYPWGNGPARCDLALFNGLRCRTDDGPMAVCSRKLGNSPFNICDLAGNVAEWTRPNKGSKPRARGGSWDSVQKHLAISSTRKVDENRPSRYGFRCVINQ